METTTPAVATPASLHWFGLMADVGLPDGVNFGLVGRPAAWLRLHAAGGTNTASFGFRGGITAIPYWFWHFGPSLSLEAGYCEIGNVNSVLRLFFQVPAWMKDYAQQAGYSYYNAHLGLEFGRGNVTGFIHVGASYVNGTVRAPNAVTVTQAPGSTGPPAQVMLGQDATVQVFTISAKVGMVVFFGGHL